MTRHRPEVADVMREHGDAYLARFGATAAQRQVLRAVQNCRTAALGGHVEACDHCGHQRVSYNSCRNRHCPKCQGSACARWLQARAAELVPVPYFHLVFTLPNAVGPIALQNQRVVYGLLFQAAAQTLLEVAANPRFLGAEIGFLAVLHTWGQNLMHHPHVHCVVPGGGLSSDGKQWIAARPGFFLPVRVLSRVFRGKFVDLLKRAFKRRELTFDGAVEDLTEETRFEQWVDQVVRHDWVVYAKRPFSGPETVLKYLARYTHRVAISNERLIALRDGSVSFRWKDYTQHGRPRTMTIAAVEFIRRFLLHVLPTGFMKIRHYGFMANRCRDSKLAFIRELLEVKLPSPPERVSASQAENDEHPQNSDQLCRQCQQGRLQIIMRLLPMRIAPPPTITVFDTS
jgi:hypothetical protein